MCVMNICLLEQLCKCESIPRCLLLRNGKCFQLAFRRIIRRLHLGAYTAAMMKSNWCFPEKECKNSCTQQEYYVLFYNLKGRSFLEHSSARGLSQKL